MKLVIAGSRTLHPPINYLKSVLVKLGLIEKVAEIVSGGASGVDHQAELFATNINLPIRVFEADWDRNGKAAGPIRNRKMAEYGDALLLIWDGESRGSRSMKTEMQRLNKPVFEIVVKRKDAP